MQSLMYAIPEAAPLAFAIGMLRTRLAVARDNESGYTTETILITAALAEQIHDWARSRLAADPNATAELGDAYQVTTLYFDTEQFDVFFRKGSFGRSKYRIRRYGGNGAAPLTSPA